MVWRLHLLDDDVREAGIGEQARELAGIPEREGVRDPGRRRRRSELGTHDVEDDAEPGVTFPGAPDREGDPSARAQHTPDLADGTGRVGHEHEPLAAEDDVVGAVRLVAALEIEHSGADVVETECLRTHGRDRRHLGDHV